MIMHYQIECMIRIIIAISIFVLYYNLVNVFNVVLILRPFCGLSHWKNIMIVFIYIRFLKTFILEGISCLFVDIDVMLNVYCKWKQYNGFDYIRLAKSPDLQRILLVVS